MKRSTKIITIITIFFLIIASVIIARTMIGNHFKKKFSKFPPPGIIVTEVIEQEFAEKLETFGTAISSKSKTFKTKKEITEIFKKILKNINSNTVVFSCGSGVTACVLALAYSLINDKYLPKIYDGSWAEYGKI